MNTSTKTRKHPKVELTDAQILATAQFSSPQTTALDESKRTMIELILHAVRLAGKQIHLVTWPNGVIILLNADPNNKATWEALIVKCYRAAAAGWLGSISVNGVHDD